MSPMSWETDKTGPAALNSAAESAKSKASAAARVGGFFGSISIRSPESGSYELRMYSVGFHPASLGTTESWYIPTTARTGNIAPKGCVRNCFTELGWMDYSDRAAFEADCALELRFAPHLHSQ